MNPFGNCKTKKKIPAEVSVEDKVFIAETQSSAALNIYFATKPMYVLSKILGIAPFVLKSDPPRLEFCKRLALYGLFLATAMTYILLRETQYIVSGMDPPLFRFVTILQLMTLMIPSVFHRLMALASSRTVILILSQLDDVDRRLRLKQPCHVKGFRYSLLIVIATTVCLVTFSFVRIFLDREIEVSRNCLSAAANVAALFAVMAFYIADCQFVGLVLLIRQRFMILNEDVLDIGSFRKIHDDLCELCETVNCCFSPQILTSVVLNFISFVYCCYFCCLSVLGQDKDSYSGVDWDVLTLYGFVIVLFNLVFKLAACHWTAAEGNRTALLLHREYDKLTDLETKMEVQMLSLQLLHNKVRFSACGIFPLDLSLLYSIVGAVTTYLVILIQFQLSTPGGNNVLERHNNVTSSIRYEIY